MVKRPLMNREAVPPARYSPGTATPASTAGNRPRELTLDHILPRSRGGTHVWENVVSACIPCNHRKAGLTPKQAEMRLLREPSIPRPNPFYLFDHRHIMDEWRQFIPWAS